MLKLDTRGMNMVELLVVLGIMGVAMAGLSSMIVNLTKAQKNIDLKGEAQSLGMTIKAVMMGKVTCKEAFSIGTPDSPTFPLTGLPGDTSGTGTYSVSLSKLMVAGQPLTLGKAHGQLLIDDMKLVLSHKTADDTYFSTLEFRLGKGNKTQSIGATGFSEAVPLLIKLEVDPLNTSRKRIESCWVTGTIDPKAVCSDLGGDWLDGPYMSASGPRCNMTKDIELSANEKPDGFPNEADGLWTTQCYYKNSDETIVRTYLCRTVTGAVAGDRCVFDTAAKQWGVYYFNKTGQQTSTRRRWCSQGVKISQPSSATETLWYSDFLGDAYGFSQGDSDTYYKELDRLNTVSRCQISYSQNTWSNCSNPTDPESATHAKVGSCVYVQNIALTGDSTQTRINQFNASGACEAGGNPSCISNKNNYTGWIRVTQARVIKYATKQIQEARGVPCFQVEINKEAASDSGYPLTPSVPAISVAVAGDSIHQCVHEKPPSETTGAPNPRRAVLVCNNGSLDPANADVTAENESCWYFRPKPSGQKLFIAGYYPSAGSGAPGGWYWVRNNASIAGNMITDPTDHSVQSNTGTVYNLVPCNAIR